jgi:hypothetical protein
MLASQRGTYLLKHGPSRFPALTLGIFYSREHDGSGLTPVAWTGEASSFAQRHAFAGLEACVRGIGSWVADSTVTNDAVTGG